MNIFVDNCPTDLSTLVITNFSHKCVIILDWHEGNDDGQNMPSYKGIYVLFGGSSRIFALLVFTN